MRWLKKTNTKEERKINQNDHYYYFLNFEWLIVVVYNLNATNACQTSVFPPTLVEIDYLHNLYIYSIVLKKFIFKSIILHFAACI
jgi:hypothetical protein